MLTLAQLFDPVKNADVVVVDAMQGCTRGGGHPGRGRTCLGVANLLLQHGRHLVRHGPHALADLGLARQAAANADIDVPVFVGLDPWLGLHLGLRDEGAGFHGGVDLVAGAVQEAGVDEHAAFLGLGNAGSEIDRRPAFLIHDADLQRVTIQTQGVFNGGKEVVGVGHFFGTVHLRFDDIHRTRPRIALVCGVALIGL